MIIATDTISNARTTQLLIKKIGQMSIILQSLRPKTLIYSLIKQILNYFNSKENTMIRAITLSILSTMSLFSANAFCSPERVLSHGLAYEFTFPSNEPQPFANTSFWTLDGTCTIKSDLEDNPFSFTVLRKSGTLNGVPLSKGDSMSLVVHPGDKLHMTAASGGKIELVNNGPFTVKATCIMK